MKIKTKIFQEIEVNEEKVITFETGIIGYPELVHFLLIHEEGEEGHIGWLQSVEEPLFALPVIDPLRILPDYNPSVEDELLKSIALEDPDDMLVLVTLTVPSDIEKMSVNLRAPIVINAAGRKACQLIAEDEDYAVKYPIYDLLKRQKEGAGE